MELSEKLRAELVAQRAHKRPWFEIEPQDALDIVLPDPGIWGPLTEYGPECRWPWDPQQLVGAPLGQYRCQYCNAMVVAGVRHVDYLPGWDSKESQ